MPSTSTHTKELKNACDWLHAIFSTSIQSGFYETFTNGIQSPEVASDSATAYPKMSGGELKMFDKSPDALIHEIGNIVLTLNRTLALDLRTEWSGDIDAIPTPLLWVLSVFSKAFRYFRHPDALPIHQERLMMVMWWFLQHPVTHNLLGDVIAGANSRRMSGPEIPLDNQHVDKVFATILNSFYVDGSMPHPHHQCPAHKHINDIDILGVSDDMGSIQILLDVLRPQCGEDTDIISLSPLTSGWMLLNNSSATSRTLDNPDLDEFWSWIMPGVPPHLEITQKVA